MMFNNKIAQSRQLRVPLLEDRSHHVIDVGEEDVVEAAMDSVGYRRYIPAKLHKNKTFLRGVLLLGLVCMFAVLLNKRYQRQDSSVTLLQTGYENAR